MTREILTFNDEVRQNFFHGEVADLVGFGDRLIDFVKEARESAMVEAVCVDGSFVTASDVPNDIDLIRREGRFQEQMGRMQRVLESFHADILPKNPGDGSWPSISKVEHMKSTTTF